MTEKTNSRVEQAPELKTTESGDMFLAFADGTECKIGEEFLVGETRVIFSKVHENTAQFLVFSGGPNDITADRIVDITLPVEDLGQLEQKITAMIASESGDTLTPKSEAILNTVAQKLDLLSLNSALSGKIKMEMREHILQEQNKLKQGETVDEKAVIKKFDERIAKFEEIRPFEGMRSDAYIEETSLPMTNIENWMANTVLSETGEAVNQEQTKDKTERMIGLMDDQFEPGRQEIITPAGLKGDERKAERDKQLREQRVSGLTDKEKDAVKLRAAQLSVEQKSELINQRADFEETIKDIRAKIARGESYMTEQDIEKMREEFNQEIESTISKYQQEKIDGHREKGKSISEAMIDRHEKRNNLFQPQLVPENFEKLSLKEQEDIKNALPEKQRKILEERFKEAPQTTMRVKQGEVQGLSEQLAVMRGIQDNSNRLAARAEAESTGTLQLIAQKEKALGEIRAAKDALQHAEGKKTREAARERLEKARKNLSEVVAKKSLEDQISRKVYQPAFADVCTEAAHAQGFLPHMYGLGGETVEQTHTRLLEGKKAIEKTIHEQMKHGSVSKKDIILLKQQEAAIAAFQQATERNKERKGYEDKLTEQMNKKVETFGDGLEMTGNALVSPFVWSAHKLLEVSAGMDARNALFQARTKSWFEKNNMGGLSWAVNLPATLIGTFPRAAGYAVLGGTILAGLKLIGSGLNSAQNLIAKYTGFDFRKFFKKSGK